MLHFPFFYNSNYYYPKFNKSFSQNPSFNYNNTHHFDNINSSDFKNTYLNQNNIKAEKKFEKENVVNTLKNNSKRNEEEHYFLELFGIKLYLDDILIISIIFFLYQEGIKDDELFISLILLLLG